MSKSYGPLDVHRSVWLHATILWKSGKKMADWAVCCSTLLHFALLKSPDLPVKDGYHSNYGGYDVDDEGSQHDAKAPGEAPSSWLTFNGEEAGIVLGYGGKYSHTYS